jgi:hypothetical protein
MLVRKYHRNYCFKKFFIFEYKQALATLGRIDTKVVKKEISLISILFENDIHNFYKTVNEHDFQQNISFRTNSATPIFNQRDNRLYYIFFPAELSDGKINFISPNTDNSKQELEKLETSSKNPLKTLIKVVNDVVNKFNVSASSSINIEDFNDLKFIKVLTKKGRRIEFKDLSTGTRQIILTAIPLVKLDTKDTIILFDEPERSLYPDIRRTLIQ